MAGLRYQNAALFLTLATLFGIAFVAIKAGLAALPPIFFSAVRFTVAGPLLLAYVARRHDRWMPRTATDLAGIVVGSTLIVALTNALNFFGQQTIPPATAAVLFSMNPILAPAFAFVVLDQRLGGIDMAGIVVGLGGVVILVQPSQTALAAGSTVGMLAVFAGAATNAFGTVLLQRVDNTLDTVPLTAWSMVCGAAILHVASVGLGGSLSGITVTPSLLCAVLFLGIPSTAVAYAIFFTLIRRIGPVRTNLMSYFVPIVAAITGWVLLGEPVTANTVLGFLVIIAGVALLERHIVADEARTIYRLAAGV